MQAVWALGWLCEHAEPGALLPGWTYLLEAVYADNIHVVQYAFEGMVRGALPFYLAVLLGC